MIRTINQIKTLFSDLDCRVFINHTTKKDNVELPYIVIVEQGSNNFIADNQVYEDISDYLIAVYVIDCYEKQSDIKLIEDIKKILKDNHIPYDKQMPEWDERNLMYRIIFQVNQ